MKNIINFIKDICMMNGSDNSLVGLAQLRAAKEVVKPQQEPKKKKDMKISDLMRGY